MPSSPSPSFPSRRDFLKGVTVAASSLATSDWGLAQVGGHQGKRGSREEDEGAHLFVIELAGGLDHLFAVPPASPWLINHRPNLSHALASMSPAPLTAGWYLHPGLDPLRPLWERGQWAILGPIRGRHRSQGPKRPTTPPSHWEAIEEWRQHPGSESKDGWAAIALRRAQFRNYETLGIELSSRPSGVFSLAEDGNSEGLEPPMINIGFDPTPSIPGQMGDGWEQSLRAMVNASTGGTRTVGFAQLRGFDTHRRQASVLSASLRDLGQALRGMMEALDRSGHQNATVLVYSEFGRSIRENREGGTDDGGPAFSWIFSPKARGGLYVPPSKTLSPTPSQLIETLTDRWLEPGRADSGPLGRALFHV